LAFATRIPARVRILIYAADLTMAFDEMLADRVRAVLAGRDRPGGPLADIRPPAQRRALA
jgi:hypothetical protein